MKLRNGFVSNSSSSSFIVSTKKDEEPIFTASINSNIRNFSTELRTIKDADEYYLEGYKYYKDINTIEDVIEKDPDIKEDYEKIKEEIEAGRVVFIGDFCNGEGDPISEFLYEHDGISNNDLKHNFNILSGDND